MTVSDRASVYINNSLHGLNLKDSVGLLLSVASIATIQDQALPFILTVFVFLQTLKLRYHLLDLLSICRTTDKSMKDRASGI